MQNHIVPNSNGQIADTDVNCDPNRRAVLAGLSTAAAGLALPGVAIGDTGETEIIKLFRRYRRLAQQAETHFCTRTGVGEDEEMDHLFWKPIKRIERDILQLPSSSAKDVLAKMAVATRDGMFVLERDHLIYDEIREHLESTS